MNNVSLYLKTRYRTLKFRYKYGDKNPHVDAKYKKNL